MARLSLAVIAALLAGIVLTSGFSALAALAPPAFAVDIDHPRAYVYGTVEKSVMFAQSIWRWEDSEGVDHYLPFEPAPNENYTIDAWFIAFEKQMENDTFTFSGSASDEWAKQLDSYGMNTWYIKNVLDDQTLNGETTTLDAALAIPVDTTTHVLCAMKLLTSDPPGAVATLVLTLTSGTTTYALRVELHDGVTRGSTNTIWHADWSPPAASFQIGCDPGDACLVCLNIEQIFNQISGLEVDIDSVTKLKLTLYTPNSTTTTSEVAEAYFRFAFFTSTSVYINSKDYGLLNTTLGTTINIPTSTGDVLNIYGAEATHAYKVTIPFIYEDEDYSIETSADEFSMSYTWQFQLPDDANAGSFTSTGLNITLNKDPDAWDYLYVNGADYLGQILNHKAGEDVTLLTGLTPGTIYTVQAKVRYTAEEWDALTAAPSFWMNPVGWLAYHWWSLLAAIASVLGLVGTASWARSKARRYKMPRR